jgi:hypothetical protein
MFTFKGKLKDVVVTCNKDTIFEIITSDNNIPYEELANFLNSKTDIKIVLSKWREKRSLDANAYAWVLMDKIARKINSTKEDVYKEIIYKKGVFEVLPIKNIAVDSFIRRWQDKGIGWLCEKMRASTIPNYTNVIVYFGTSTYDTKEMSEFIDEVVNIAKSYGIQTETPEKLKEIKSLWETYYETKKQ